MSVPELVTVGAGGALVVATLLVLALRAILVNVGREVSDLLDAESRDAGRALHGDVRTREPPNVR